MTDSIRTRLFPKTFREMPHRRLILNTLRSAHLLCICFMVGGVYFQQDKAELALWIAAVVITGLGMFLVDLYGSCIILLEIRGAGVLIKLLLLAGIPFLDKENQILLLVVVIILSSFISHGARQFRHKRIIPQSFQDHFGLPGDDKK